MTLGQIVSYLLPGLPFVFAFSIFGVASYRWIPGLGRRQSWQKAVLFGLLIGWFSAFVYVTQFMNFGGLDAVNVPNFHPMVQWRLAWREGVTNAQQLSQFYLNVLLCMPAGALATALFNFRRPLLVSLVGGLSISSLTESVQWLTGRSSDIDDVIANTVGAVVGSALVLLVNTCVIAGRKWWENRSRSEENHQARSDRLAGRITSLVIIVALVPASYAVLLIHELSNPYGYLFYGQARPTSITLSTDLPTSVSTRGVYKVAQSKTRPSNLFRNLTGNDPSKCNFLPSTEPYERAQTMCQTGSESLSVYVDGTWDYDFPQAKTKTHSKI